MNRENPYINYYKLHLLSSEYAVTIFYVGSTEDDLDVAFVDFRYFSDTKLLEYISSTAPISKEKIDPYNYNVITSKEFLEELIAFMVDNNLGEVIDPITSDPYRSIRYSELLKLLAEDKQNE